VGEKIRVKARQNLLEISEKYPNKLDGHQDAQGSQRPKHIYVVPYRKGIKLMSERESIEMANHGEVQRWSSDSEADELPKDIAESEEPTEFGVMWERYVIKETEETEVEPTIVELHIMNEECKNKKPATIWEQSLPSELSSPRLIDYESDGENPSQIS
jgi:hypothetical protein